MTGYLDRLAARSLGAPPAAAPRPRSLFEDATDAAPGPGAARDAVPIPEAIAPAVPGGSPPIRPVATSALPSVAKASRAQSRADKRAEAPAGRDTGTTERMPEHTANGGARHPFPAGDPQAEIAAGRSVRATASTAPAPDDLAVAAPRATADPVRVRPARAESAGARTEDAPPAPVPEPPGPDVIHVTIGRVDVRASVAATPPAPVPRSQPAEKVLSLHDYLRGERAR
ncbi:MAG: hypothetical protein ABWZ16_02055 [Microbacterium sp.]